MGGAGAGHPDLPAAEKRVHEARRVVAKLEHERTASSKRSNRLFVEREGIAFDAHIGDKAAAKRLAEIHAEIAREESEAISLAAALAEARRRFSEAEEALARVRLCGRALAARQHLGALRAAGADADAALKGFVAHLARVHEIGDEIRRINLSSGAYTSPVPSRDLMRVNTNRALQTELGRVKLAAEVVAPSDRHDLSDLIDSWCDRIDGHLDILLGEPAPAEAETHHVTEEIVA